ACLGMHSRGACTLAAGDAWMALGLLGVLCAAAYTGRQLVTTVLTWRATALVPALSRRLATWVQARHCSGREFLRADGAGEPWIERRQKAIDRLAMFFQAHYAQSIAW